MTGVARKDEASVPVEPAGEKPHRLTEAEKLRWMEENREAFRSYDEHVEKNGLFGDGRRLF